MGPGAPLLIAGPVQTESVFAASPETRAAGVQIGMSLYHARQMLPAALALPADEPAYLAAHGALEAALRGLTPAVETVGLGQFLADVRGLVAPRRGALPRHGDAGLRGNGDAGLRGDGDAGLRGNGDAGLRGDGDAGLRGNGDAGLRGDGDAGLRGDGDAGLRGNGDAG
ncbi:MAG: hypothetical protein HY784_14060, partial [Chloroflexi bacterium]|nr:hypothetical protein [Chloroflexota bacterium]